MKRSTQPAWPLGTELKTHRVTAHFAGCRFGRFNGAASAPGGHADFDFFRLGDRMLAKMDPD